MYLCYMAETSAGHGTRQSSILNRTNTVQRSTCTCLHNLPFRSSPKGSNVQRPSHMTFLHSYPQKSGLCMCLSLYTSGLRLCSLPRSAEVCMKNVSSMSKDGVVKKWGSRCVMVATRILEQRLWWWGEVYAIFSIHTSLCETEAPVVGTDKHVTFKESC